MPAAAEKISVSRRLRRIERLLRQLVARAEAGEVRYLSVAAAAQRASISPTTIRDWLTSGRLTGYRPCPGRVLVDPRELDSLIASATRATSRRGSYDRAREAT